jgi:hypothetical protein
MRLSALSARLKQPGEAVSGWGRLREAAARLPSVTVAIPIIAGAVTAFLQGKTVDAKGILRAALLLSITAFLVWLLFVWPSIRLGFRVKRAIFAGGQDLRNPLMNNPGEVQWQHRTGTRLYEDAQLVRWPNKVSYLFDRPWKALFATLNPRSRLRGVHAPEGWTDFPTEDVYQLEGRVFGLLGERRPRELPLDMLLSAPPYVLLLVVVSLYVGVADSIGLGQWGDLAWAVPLTLLFTGLFFRVLLQAIRNHRARSGGGPVDWADLIPYYHKRGTHRIFVGLAIHEVGESELGAVAEQIQRAVRKHPKEFPLDLLKDLGLEEDLEGHPGSALTEDGSSERSEDVGGP